MFKQKFFIFLFLFLIIGNSSSKKILSDYRSYPKTDSQIIIEKIVSGGIKYPWGMTFIDDENLLVTEKNGRLLQIKSRSINYS